MLAEQARHLRVQLDQRDRFDARVLEHLTCRHAVAAAQNRHFARCAAAGAEAGHRRVHQGLVVAVFVALGELEVAVQKQPVA